MSKLLCIPIEKICNTDKLSRANASYIVPLSSWSGDNKEKMLNYIIIGGKLKLKKAKKNQFQADSFHIPNILCRGIEAILLNWTFASSLNYQFTTTQMDKKNMTNYYVENRAHLYFAFSFSHASVRQFAFWFINLLDTTKPREISHFSHVFYMHPTGSKAINLK